MRTQVLTSRCSNVRSAAESDPRPSKEPYGFSGTLTCTMGRTPGSGATWTTTATCRPSGAAGPRDCPPYISCSNVTVNSDTQVTATVPNGAITGKIVITTTGGTATSSGTFTVAREDTFCGQSGGRISSRSLPLTSHSGLHQFFSVRAHPLR